jgi:hypothetical protein
MKFRTLLAGVALATLAIGLPLMETAHAAKTSRAKKVKKSLRYKPGAIVTAKNGQRLVVLSDEMTAEVIGAPPMSLPVYGMEGPYAHPGGQVMQTQGHPQTAMTGKKAATPTQTASHPQGTATATAHPTAVQNTMMAGQVHPAAAQAMYPMQGGMMMYPQQAMQYPTGMQTYPAEGYPQGAEGYGYGQEGMYAQNPYG